MYDAILFDLDGTLLPMDMDEFTSGYFALLAEKAAPLGYDPKALIGAVWRGIAAMVANDGGRTNRERFWDAFAAVLGEEARVDEELFRSFYSNEFREAVRFTNPAPEKARRAVSLARSRAAKVLLATNPLFPDVGTEARLGWIGLTPSDFDLVTTYEDTRYCKPNPLYYAELLGRAGLAPDGCLMIGNDVGEDAEAAAHAGLRSYLVTDCLINRSGRPLEVPNGTLDELLDALASSAL